ncbi:MAG: carbohydrate ABC transporter permease, partial [Oscillospiraceae bacterium]
MKMRKGTTALVTLLGTLIAAYTLFPFLLVVINTMKANSNIVADPVGFSGANFSTMMENLNKVINNSNFVFWNAFGTSAIITVISLVLLAVLGGMAAWVICRNKTKWSTVIYMTFIASMTIPFQVVMLPLISTFRDVGNFI